MQLKLYIGLILFMALASSCQKDLNVKSDKELAVPTTLQDFQAILDNTYKFNTEWPFSGVASADNFYVTFNDWQSASLTARNLYIWKDDVFNDRESNDWSLCYTAIFYANVVLDYMPKGIDKNSDWENIEGQALFFRSFAFYELLQIFAPPYDKASVSSDLGVSLRLSSDMNVPSKRSTVEECYEQVLKDLKKAVRLLPKQNGLKTRPTKIAAYALLARVYLSIRDYSNALLYADSTLDIDSVLIDYNTLDSTDNDPISIDYALHNDEIIFYSFRYTDDFIQSPIARIDTSLFASYDKNDLRRSIFYTTNSDDSHFFRGSYSGLTYASFNGLATDEMYLIKAECQARAGNPNQAMASLNHLLYYRWKKGSYIPFDASDQTDALSNVLKERRKELVYRGLRWTDLRRLNMEKNYQVTIYRLLGGKRYTLPPNDPRYTLPIPDNVISITGMEQNVR